MKIVHAGVNEKLSISTKCQFDDYANFVSDTDIHKSSGAYTTWNKACNLTDNTITLGTNIL